MTDALCPACGDSVLRCEYPDLYDDRYGYPGFFAVQRCATCGHRHLVARFSEQELTQLYTLYYPRARMDPASWAVPTVSNGFRSWLGREASAAFRWVPPNVTVLDIGCGTGESLAYHQSRGCKAVGVEPDENVARFASRFGLTIRGGVFRAADFAGQQFDVVTLDQVIEHSADPVQLLREAASVLRPGGELLLSTPNVGSLSARVLGRRWVHWHVPYHLQLFTKTSIRHVAAAAGLECRWIRHVTSPRWYAFQWLHLLALPPAGQPSLFWSGDAPWPRGRWLLRKLLSGAGRLGLNHLLALGLDGLRVGDNLVAALHRDE